MVVKQQLPSERPGRMQRRHQRAAGAIGLNPRPGLSRGFERVGRGRRARGLSCLCCCCNHRSGVGAAQRELRSQKGQSAGTGASVATHATRQTE